MTSSIKSRWAYTDGIKFTPKSKRKKRRRKTTPKSNNQKENPNG